VYPQDSVLADYVAQQSLETESSLDDETSRYLTDDDMRESPQAYTEIEEALGKLQTYLPQPELDQRWIQRFTDYMSQIIAAKRARTPREQFNYLYHLRKLLFWAPVSLLSLRSGDMQSLLVLSHFYAAALKLEEVFPDIGVSYLGNLVLPPLQEILRVLRVCQTNPAYANIAHTTSMLIDFPQNAVNDYMSRRSWTSRQSSLATGLAPPIEIENSDLGSQYSGQYSYTPTLSPAFSATHLASPPPINTAVTPRSPFLTVPGTESYTYASYGTSPIGSYTASPLLSPGLKFPNEDEYSITQAEYNPTILTTPAGADELSTYESYRLSSGSGMGGYPGMGGGAIGGCVVPTAIWG
jgi:hypothetical protein